MGGFVTMTDIIRSDDPRSLSKMSGSEMLHQRFLEGEQEKKDKKLAKKREKNKQIYRKFMVDIMAPMFNIAESQLPNIKDPEKEYLVKNGLGLALRSYLSFMLKCVAPIFSISGVGLIVSSTSLFSYNSLAGMALFLTSYLGTLVSGSLFVLCLFVCFASSFKMFRFWRATKLLSYEDKIKAFNNE
jgi:hypothetical protein